MFLIFVLLAVIVAQNLILTIVTANNIKLNKKIYLAHQRAFSILIKAFCLGRNKSNNDPSDDPDDDRWVQDIEAIIEMRPREDEKKEENYDR